MAQLQSRSLAQPDETRPVDKGVVEVVRLDAATMMRTTFQPGWRWSECVKPIVGGESCQVNHVGYCVSGRLHVRMDSGDEMEIGRATRATSRRDTMPGSWATSSTSAIDFSGAEEYAKALPSRAPRARRRWPAARRG